MRYKARNEIAAWVRQHLGAIDPDMLEDALQQVASGQYDSVCSKGRPLIISTFRGRTRSTLCHSLVHGVRTTLLQICTAAHICTVVVCTLIITGEKVSQYHR